MDLKKLCNIFLLLKAKLPSADLTTLLTFFDVSGPEYVTCHMLILVVPYEI